MGNSESSSQFPPPSNNGNGDNSSDDEGGATAPSALQIGAAVAGSALLALGAYTMASSSSSHSGDGDGDRKRVTHARDVEPEGFGRHGGGGRGVNNHRGQGPSAGWSNQCLASQTIKIMSYNVWFREDVEVVERMEAIGRLIGENRPDLIFFQEVTPNIYRLFQRSSWWTMYPYRSVPPEKATRRYFCMMLCKLPVKQFICKPFENSGMGRELCLAEIDAGAHKLVAATSHLESPTPPAMNGAERVAQAREAMRFLNSAPNVIFGGDMNWDDASDGPFPLLAGWQDAWSVLRPGDQNGWTYDTKANVMLKGNRPLQKRLDRFVCKLQDFSMETVDMIGRDPIAEISYYNKGKELPVLPSDHFGLVLTIRPIPGSALLALAAYTLASSSSSHSGDGDGDRKRVTQMRDVEPEGFVHRHGVNNHRGQGPYAGWSNQRLASQTIKIMSYNVWLHEDVQVGKRTEAIGQLIEEESPDIIFFQEVTRNIYKLLEGSNWWGEYRCCFDPSERAIATRRSDFCMLLSKLPVKRFLCEPHENSNMGKGLCVAEIDAGRCKSLIVATSHLMKPNGDRNRNARMSQAEEAIRRLEDICRTYSGQNVIFGGDMNWNDESNRHPFPLLDRWLDAWSVLRPGEKGWTFDTKANMMLGGRSSVQKRLDRFVCKLQDFRMVSVDMIGMDAIPGISYYDDKGNELPVLPSDHFGLVLTICPI